MQKPPLPAGQTESCGAAPDDDLLAASREMGFLDLAQLSFREVQFQFGTSAVYSTAARSRMYCSNARLADTRCILLLRQGTQPMRARNRCLGRLHRESANLSCCRNRGGNITVSAVVSLARSWPFRNTQCRKPQKIGSDCNISSRRHQGVGAGPPTASSPLAGSMGARCQSPT